MKLLNKTVIITGASDGIGKAIALKLAKEGCELALIGRDESKLDAVKKGSKNLDASDVQAYSCDITNRSELEKTVFQISKDFPSGPNILINNAGIWHKMMDTEKLDADLIDQVIATNLTAHIQLTRLLLPGLRKAKEAAILNIVSRSGITAQGGQSVYTASKWGMKGFTEVLKADLKKTHVRVAALYQGGTHTDMFAKAGETFSSEKFTEPENLADVVAFMLACPKKIWLHEVHVEH